MAAHRSGVPWPSAVATTALLLAARPGAAAAPADRYVLTPAAAAPVAAAFRRMEPVLRHTDIAIEPDAVGARLCRGDACFGVRLEHPSHGCGPTWGAFCARFPDGPVPPDVGDVMERALQSIDAAAVWTRLDGDPVPEPPAHSEAPMIGLALTITSALAGGLIGRLGRWLGWPRQRGVWFTLGALAGLPVCALLLDTRLQLVGAWDALYVGGAVALGLLLTLHRELADWKNLALLLVSCVACGAGLEVATRVGLPPPPTFPSANGPTLWLSDLLRDAPGRAYSTTAAGVLACHALHGGSEPAPNESIAFPGSWRPRPGVRTHVLHLGDSMVYGAGSHRFTDELNALEPDAEHVNAAIPGAAPDVYLAVLRRFLAEHQLDAVVMHLSSNDYEGIDAQVYPCSDWKSLLLYEPDRTRLRVAAGGPDSALTPLVWLLRNSPPPYALRAAVDVSSAAAYLSAVSVWLGGYVTETRPDQSEAVFAQHLRAILRDARDELRARHVPFVTTIIRDRRAVEAGTQRTDAEEDKMRRISEDLGIVTLDTWEPLRAAVERGERLYLGAEDPHYDRAGHAVVAAWLHAALPAALARAASVADAGSKK